LFNENASYVAALLLVFGLSFSESILSISSVALFVLAFLTGNFRQKIEWIAREKSLWALIGVFLIYLLGCLFCRDANTGMYELKKNIFWILIPLGVAFMPKMNDRKRGLFLLSYVVIVGAATLVATLKLLMHEHFGITDVRDASYVSHVAFSLQIVFSIYVLVYARMKRLPVIGSIPVFGLILWCIWLLIFLGFQKSLIGFLTLLGSGIVFLVGLIRKAPKRWVKRGLGLLLLLFLLVPPVYVGRIAYRFFHINETEPDFSLRTASGNSYWFDTSNHLLENGFHVYWYLCDAELEKSWNSISTVKIDEQDAAGYRVYDTLVRYMTSKGLKKDSAGVAALDSSDVNNILSGMANYLFAEKKYTLYPRIYQTIWELYHYSQTGDPNNQSLSQRIEYTKAAWDIIRHHFWGIGTGNYRIEFEKAFERIQSRLYPEFRFNVHNQYLNYIVKFGVPGFAVILWLLFFAIRQKKQFRNPLMVLLLIIIGIACLGDTTLETHVGLPFFLLFLSLFLWHFPQDEIQNNLPGEQERM